jgi:hypothetical protein
MKYKSRKKIYIIVLIFAIALLILQFRRFHDFGHHPTGKPPNIHQKSSAEKSTPLNFKFCTMLNGSSFQIPIHFNKGTFRRQIDTAALEIMNKYKKGDMIIEEMKRFSCFMASMGENEFLRSVPTRLLGPTTNHGSKNLPALRNLNPFTYFAKLFVPVSWDIERFEFSSPQTSVNSTTKAARKKWKPSAVHMGNRLESKRYCKVVETNRHYKIVYFMLVHQDYKQLVQLLELIHDPDGFYLLHVDERSMQLYEDMQAHIHSRYYSKGFCNVKVVSRWTVLWGGGSIILAQLDIYFQSLKLKYDYIVNMSAYCIPLYSLSTLHSLLQDLGYQAWMLVGRDSEPDRVEQVWIPNRSGWMTGLHQNRKYKLESTFPAWKQDQWMILSRGMIDWMKRTKETYLLLAWFEHSFIPDEHYFATLIMKHFPHKVFTGGVWYRVFEGDFHPKWLTKSELFRTLPQEYFARKVNLSESNDIIQFVRDKWRRNDHN